ncbi:AAA-type ATPase lid domain-containing protein [Athalassotoga saccharophila]|uniref:sigma 54-interacting transcriptional regulator n=1 Tax=Athalassotoga saccharophila TaxID=1441386 RepID=UPI00137A3D15|nr:sigma 54-interacting transcriptional regulator [Athalassotoga saccharophila]BBJ28976.1 DNA-binding transcriptional regulator NtrC [Athalassotoga saccharophila]
MNAFFLGFDFKDSTEIKMRSTEIHKINGLSQLKKFEEEKVLCINGSSSSPIDDTSLRFIVEEVKKEKTHLVVIRDDKNHFKEFEREIAFIDGPSLKPNEIIANFVSMVRSSMQKFVGESRKIMELKSKIFNACFSDRNFFITGETGSGKHLLAEVVHKAGLRSEGPFVLIGRDLKLENNFDLERGHLFIEEIDSITKDFKDKICDLVKKKRYRIISATKIAEKDEGFSCFDEVVLKIPPLRERKCDIPILTDHFIKDFGYDFHFEELPFEMQQRLLEYTYPANVKELKNIINDYIFGPHHERDFQEIFISNFISNTIFELMNKTPGNSNLLKSEIENYFRNDSVKELIKKFKWEEGTFSNIFDSYTKKFKDN